MTVAEAMAEGREDLHDHMKRKAYCFGRSRSSESYGENFGIDYGGEGGDVILPIYCRKNDARVKPIGDIRGDDYLDRIERYDVSLKFLIKEFTPEDSDKIIFSATEGYRVQIIEPPHGVTINAQCTQMEDTEVAELWEQVQIHVEP